MAPSPKYRHRSNSTTVQRTHHQKNQFWSGLFLGLLGSGVASYYFILYYLEHRHKKGIEVLETFRSEGVHEGVNIKKVNDASESRDHTASWKVVKPWGSENVLHGGDANGGGRVSPSGKDVVYNFIADAVESVLDSVVNITVEVDTSNVFQRKSLVSTGSGFFVDEDGTILTNAHVVSDFAEGGILVISTPDGEELDGEVHSLDLLSDLAVVKLRGKSDKKWPAVKFATNKNLRPGDWVIAIGNPFGLTGTVTAGIVSSRRRKPSEIHSGQDARLEYIQTDCVVHSGSSGGPLINLDGEVVGINTTRAESEGISFAIRVDNAMDIIQALVHKGRVVRPWLGMRMLSLTPPVWSQLKSRGGSELLPSCEDVGEGSGVLVTALYPHSPADHAHVRPGDVIISTNGSKVRTSCEILKIIGLKVGSPVKLVVKRKDQSSGVVVEKALTITPQELDILLTDHVNFLL
ncbi:hypothetical protein SeMB42_g04959 [Synchytrium endobioticum]|uniref:PDZ domain-containing protein n=1 Tax=Synchytrium endobioticum TaxID=286115 RepID=A0A507CUP0_9FUNG|nr:hypothetical protein SeMB42_g04962 [Synchytrium endobioticum]TPX42877.1 hypothetical protein SeMB42_g04959 [Synchytrium endobioticum]